MKTILGHSTIRAALVLVISAFALSACHYHGHGGHRGGYYGKGGGSYGKGGHGYGKGGHRRGGHHRGYRFRHGGKY